MNLHRRDQQDTTLTFASIEPVHVEGSSEFNFLNADGFSYGYFKMDDQTKKEFLSNPGAVNDPVFRASMWINCWEGMLRGDGPTPAAWISYSLNSLEVEDNPLLIDFLLADYKLHGGHFYQHLIVP